MPSTTFFNLPAEKRDKLLAAAIQEFRRVPYSEASINKIIQTAEIPRGSFYTYFLDKEDLFLYLLTRYWGALFPKGMQCLRENDGDAFSLFYCLFDELRPDLPSEQRDRNVVELCDIMYINASVCPSVMTHFQQDLKAETQIMDELLPAIDVSRLWADTTEELLTILRILYGQVILCLMGCLTGCYSASQARLNLEAAFSLLRRGVMRPEQSLS